MKAFLTEKVRNIAGKTIMQLAKLAMEHMARLWMGQTPPFFIVRAI